MTVACGWITGQSFGHSDWVWWVVMDHDEWSMIMMMDYDDEEYYADNANGDFPLTGEQALDCKQTKLCTERARCNIFLGQLSQGSFWCSGQVSDSVPATAFDIQHGFSMLSFQNSAVDVFWFELNSGNSKGSSKTWPKNCLTVSGTGILQSSSLSDVNSAVAGWNSGTGEPLHIYIYIWK